MSNPFELQRLITQLGDANLLDALPAPTLHRILAHTDDVVFVKVSEPLVELPDLDLEAGYQVYDAEFQLLSDHTAADGLEERVWGLAEGDWVFLLDYAFGDYAYLTYTGVTGEVRTVLLVHAG